MGSRHNFLVTFCVFAILTAFGFIFPKITLPLANAASAQTLPLISPTEIDDARDVNTFQLDKTLEAACRKSGQKGTICLCVTHVLKYELSLKEYSAVTRLYGQSENRDMIQAQLYAEGYHKADIDTAIKMAQHLIQNIDFAERCANAKAYYKTTRR